MNKSNIDLSSIYRFIINTILLVIIIFLFLLSFYSTSHITMDFVEKTYYVKDNSKLNVLLIIIFLVLLYLFRNSKLYIKINKAINDEKVYRKYKYLFLSIILLISLLWVSMTRIIPGDDQLFIQDGASNLINHDYHMFNQKGYFSKFHHQIGLMFFTYLISLLFGSYNFLVFQIINCFATFFLYKALVEIMDLLSIKRIYQLYLLILGIIFIPMIMYSSFIYGNTLGLMASLIAIKYELKYFDSNKIINIIISSIFITFAIIFKQSYQIFFIGLVVHGLMMSINKKDYKKLISIFILVIGYLFATKVPVYLAEIITKETLNQGISPLAYVAMGLQESFRAPGWFNTYVDQNYTDAYFLTEKSQLAARPEIVSRLKYFLNNISDAIRFFTLKIASVWNNPTFQSLWVNQVREASIKHNNFIYYILSPQGSDLISSLLNPIHLLILFGSSLYMIFNKHKELKYYLLPLIFVGGFIFHIFWEGKAQYVLAYFILLFPFAIQGYSLTLDNIDLLKEKGINEYYKDNKGLLYYFFIGLITLLLFVLCIKNVNDNTEDKFFYQEINNYQDYLFDHNTIPKVKNGIYKINNETHKGLTAYDVLLLTNNANDIEVINDQGITYFYFIDKNKYLAHDVNNMKLILVNEYNPEICNFIIKKTKDNKLYIICDNNLAITRDINDKSLRLEVFNYYDNQYWLFE